MTLLDAFDAMTMHLAGEPLPALPDMPSRVHRLDWGDDELRDLVEPPVAADDATVK